MRYVESQDKQTTIFVSGQTFRYEKDHIGKVQAVRILVFGPEKADGSPSEPLTTVWLDLAAALDLNQMILTSIMHVVGVTK